MKKLLMSVAFVAAVAAGYTMTGSNESELNMSDLAKANVEALAQHVDIGPICAEICERCWCIYIWEEGGVVLEDDYPGDFVR